MRATILAAAGVALLLEGCTGPGLCVHGRNWPFKIGMDAQARDVSLDPVPTTIDELRAVPHVERPPVGRIAPVELTTYVLRDVELRSFQRAPDGDVHMVLADEHGHTMIAEAAPPFCTDVDSPWRGQITAVRTLVDHEIPMAMMGWRHQIVSMAGVGYLDSLHGQMGVAPNGIEIHPVLAMCFGKGCTLPDIRPHDASHDVATATRSLQTCVDAARFQREGDGLAVARDDARAALPRHAR
jgi:hypothetical protein